jgi:hypothetical protein
MPKRRARFPHPLHACQTAAPHTLALVAPAFRARFKCRRDTFFRGTPTPKCETFAPAASRYLLIGGLARPICFLAAA